MPSLPQEIGRRVRIARIRLEITQAELAERLELEEATVRAVEAGRRGLSLDSLVRMAGVLGVRPGDLINQDEKPATGIGHEAAVIVNSMNLSWQRSALRILREIRDQVVKKPGKAARPA